MKKPQLSSLSVDELLARFVEIGVQQHAALLWDDVRSFNRLFKQLMLVEEELQRNGGEERRSLMRLYGHPNFQVRLNAAKATLAVARQEAEAELRAIQESRHMPQAGDAGMSLVFLKDGTYKPK